MTDLRSGLILGGYKLHEPLEDAETVATWAATRVETHEDVVIKFVDDPHQDRWEALLHGIASSRGLRHPAVLAPYDIFPTADGCIAVATQRLAGESLAKCLRRTPVMSFERAASIFLPVVSALRAAHGRKVFHLSLRPAAIFVVDGVASRRGRVRLLDFGLPGSDPTELPIQAACYLAPEQLGARHVDHRADIWSLGLLLYRVLSGILPTQADSLGKLRERVMLRPIPPLAYAAPSVPLDVSVLVESMLSLRRADRPDDLGELERLLCRCPISSDEARTNE